MRRLAQRGDVDVAGQGVIREFRENGGVLSQLPFPVVLPSTTGARTGRRTTTPVGFGVIAARVPAFGEYEKNTDRTFPVVALEGVPAPA